METNKIGSAFGECIGSARHSRNMPQNRVVAARAVTTLQASGCLECVSDPMSFAITFRRLDLERTRRKQMQRTFSEILSDRTIHAAG
jgi:hypothetical protein